MLRNPFFLWAFSGLILAGCMNNAGVQDMYMASSIMNGVATIAGNVGRHGGGTSVPGVLIGAGQVASGAAALASSPNVRSGTGKASATRLPDTPECRDYLSYASHAGAPGTYSVLLDKYHRCLNSAPDHPAANANRCGKGRYRHYRNGVEVCGRA